MFSSNSIRTFLVFLMLSCHSCGLWRGETGANTSPAPVAAEELKSPIPFSTVEPTVYQTEIVVTANDAEDVTFTARSETRRLTIYNFKTESETSVLELGANQIFTMASSRKIYAERDAGGAIETADFFNAELLNRKTGARFEKLGAENNLARYLVSLDDAANSEIVVSVDERIGLPVKQEFYSVGDAGKSLTYALELRNFSLNADAKFFEIPSDYRKVSAREFGEIVRRGKQTK